MKTSRSLLVAGVIAVATTLTLAAVSVRFDESADFSGYATYAWKKGTPARLSRAEQRIVAAVNRELRDRGLREVSANPGLYVMTYALVDEHTIESLADSTYWEYWTNVTSVNAYAVQAGTLVVDLVDASTDRPVWRGVASETIKGALAKEEKKIDRVVRKMFKRYPPR